MDITTICKFVNTLMMKQPKILIEKNNNRDNDYLRFEVFLVFYILFLSICYQPYQSISKYEFYAPQQPTKDDRLLLFIFHFFVVPSLYLLPHFDWKIFYYGLPMTINDQDCMVSSSNLDFFIRLLVSSVSMVTGLNSIFLLKWLLLYHCRQ